MSDAREPTAGTHNGEGPTAGRQFVPLEPPPPTQAPQCYGDVCITCSDEAVPVRVVRLLGDDLALVDTGVSREEVSVALVDAVVGDTVLVHAKEALAVVEAAAEGDMANGS